MEKKLGYLWGVDVKSQLGACDWQILKYLDESKFNPYLFGIRETDGEIEIPGIQVYSPKIEKRIPILTHLFLSLLYTRKAIALNFLFNGQVWVALKHYGRISTSIVDFQSFRNQLADNARREKAIQQLLAYGSLSRDARRETSDLGVRVIRQPGIWNGIRASWFVKKERSRA